MVCDKLAGKTLLMYQDNITITYRGAAGKGELQAKWPKCASTHTCERASVMPFYYLHEVGFLEKRIVAHLLTFYGKCPRFMGSGS